MPTNFALQSPLHIAVIPGGDGRWALARGLPQSDGHRAGVEALRRVVRAAPDLGVGVLTIRGLSCDEPLQPAPEVLSILACLGTFLDLETPACVRASVRVTVLGCRARLPADVHRAIEAAERATVEGTRLHLRLALDYSARGTILASLLAGIVGPSLPALEPAARLGPDVDVLICAGGEQRLGDFLLWECAHAELVFVDTPWPEFGERELAAAVAEFHRRRRRFGALPAAVGDDSPALGSRMATSPASQVVT